MLETSTLTPDQRRIAARELRATLERRKRKIGDPLGREHWRSAIQHAEISARPGPPRADQIWPDWLWRIWLIQAGRGWGKTRVGAETTIDFAVAHPGTRIAVLGRTAKDVRDTCFEGESGLLACLPRACRERYNRTLSELTLPNGTYIKGFSAEEPDGLRGPQHHFAWADEAAAWARAQETWDMLMLGLRLGQDPRCVVTTTPKPISLIRELIKSPTTHVTRGSTYDNRANLAPAFFEEIIKKYEGTRLGRQEIEAELLEEAPGALWTRLQIEGLRVEKAPEMQRILVAIDPAVTSNEHSDETGIIACGKGMDGNGYILADSSCRMKPHGWAQTAIDLYRELQANAIVAEVNNGGDMIEATIHAVDANVRVIQVRASRGKAVRAEPISAIYEKKRAHHVGVFRELEDQMCAIGPDFYALPGSPDRCDAMVWAMTELFGHDRTLGLVEYMKQEHEIMKVKTSQMLKPSLSADTLRCPKCDSASVVQIGIIRRCNQCGAQFGESPAVYLGPARSDFVKQQSLKN